MLELVGKRIEYKGFRGQVIEIDEKSIGSEIKVLFDKSIAKGCVGIDKTNLSSIVVLSGIDSLENGLNRQLHTI